MLRGGGMGVKSDLDKGSLLWDGEKMNICVLLCFKVHSCACSVPSCVCRFLVK